MLNIHKLSFSFGTLSLLKILYFMARSTMAITSAKTPWTRNKTEWRCQWNYSLLAQANHAGKSKFMFFTTSIILDAG